MKESGAKIQCRIPERHTHKTLIQDRFLIEPLSKICTEIFLIPTNFVLDHQEAGTILLLFEDETMTMIHVRKGHSYMSWRTRDEISCRSLFSP